MLFDPNSYDPQEFDAETRRLPRATIDWFEGQGKKRLLDDDLAAAWPADFVEFVKREKLFATFLTPSDFAADERLHGKPSSTPAQQEWAVGAVRKPVPDAERFGRARKRVKAYDGAYEMRP